MTTTNAGIEMPIIEVSHVSTRFGDAVVHKDVSLTVHRGEVFAIAGGNGCGKSTLMREIIGLQEPNSGIVRLFGIDSWRLHEGRHQDIYRRFGVMYQQGALFSSMTLAENVAAPLKEHTNMSPHLIDEIVALKIASGWDCQRIAQQNIRTSSAVACGGALRWRGPS